MDGQPKVKERYWSLQDYVVYLVASRQTEGSAFQSLLKFYGREKLVKIWKEHKEKNPAAAPRNREPGDDDDD